MVLKPEQSLAFCVSSFVMSEVRLGIYKRLPSLKMIIYLDLKCFINAEPVMTCVCVCVTCAAWAAGMLSVAAVVSARRRLGPL